MSKEIKKSLWILIFVYFFIYLSSGPIIIYTFFTNYSFLIFIINNLITFAIFLLILFCNNFKILDYKITKQEFCFSALFALFLIALLFLVNFIINNYFINLNWANVLFFSDFTKNNFWISLISFGFLVPFIKEIIFRYSFIKLWTTKNIVSIVLVTSTLYALLEISSITLTGNFSQLYFFPFYLIFGVILSYLFIKTNKLITSIFCHSLFNIMFILLVALNLI